MPFMDATITFFLVILISTSSLSSAQTDESREPPLEFSVNVGGKAITITEGETRKLAGTFADPDVSIEIKPYRVFQMQGIKFEYPRSLVFDANLDNPSVFKRWSLSGNDVTITVMSTKEKVSPMDYAKSMMKSFGRDKSEVKDTNATIRLGSLTLHGTTIQHEIQNLLQQVEIFQIASNDDVTKFIIFQDFVDSDGNRSPEGIQVLELLAASFSVKP
jgi:hypothetical protein